MGTTASDLSCQFYGTGYFIFAKTGDDNAWEAIIEVDDERQGQEMIAWLRVQTFIASQLMQVANDNVPEFAFNS